HKFPYSPVREMRLSAKSHGHPPVCRDHREGREVPAVVPASRRRLPVAAVATATPVATTRPRSVGLVTQERRDIEHVDIGLGGLVLTRRFGRRFLRGCRIV